MTELNRLSTSGLVSTAAPKIDPQRLGGYTGTRLGRCSSRLHGVTVRRAAALWKITARRLRPARNAAAALGGAIWAFTAKIAWNATAALSVAHKRYCQHLQETGPAQVLRRRRRRFSQADLL